MKFRKNLRPCVPRSYVNSLVLTSPAGTLNKCSNFEESMKLCRNVEYDHLNYFSYSAIRNLIRHAIYFKLKNVISETLIRMTL